MAGPYITIDVDKVEHNTRTIVDLCHACAIEVAGVTKVSCGHPAVARAMLRGGVHAIADSRLENIHRLRAAGVDARFLLLRVPPLSGVDAVVESVDLSLNSELAVLEGLSAAAGRRGQVHDVIIMVDLGDLREGVWPDDLLPFVREAVRFPGIRILGLGTNLGCFGGVMPDRDTMERLVELARGIEATLNLRFEYLSGINSSGLDLIASGCMPQRINHARLGEAILLGRETTHRRAWPGTYQDAFVLHAEVLEVKHKPSRPLGTRSEDAFGHLPVFEDRGDRDRALLNLGREDVDVDGITPTDSSLGIVGASSGYLVLDVSDTTPRIRVGDELTFLPNYSALLRAMTSGYVTKQVLRGGVPVEDDR